MTTVPWFVGSAEGRDRPPPVSSLFFFPEGGCVGRAFVRIPTTLRVQGRVHDLELILLLPIRELNTGVMAGCNFARVIHSSVYRAVDFPRIDRLDASKRASRAGYC